MSATPYTERRISLLFNGDDTSLKTYKLAGINLLGGRRSNMHDESQDTEVEAKVTMNMEDSEPGERQGGAQSQEEQQQDQQEGGGAPQGPGGGGADVSVDVSTSGTGNQGEGGGASQGGGSGN